MNGLQILLTLLSFKFNSFDSKLESEGSVSQVKADIRTVPSEVYASAFTLRFPRVTALRTDKGHEDIMTLQELNELVHHYGGKLKRNAFGMETPRNQARKRSFSVPLHFSKTPAKARRGHEAFLKDMIVYFSDYGQYGKEKLERLAQELGAVVYMNPSRRVDFILGADLSNPTVQRIAFDGKYDIVSAEWLLRCEAENQKLPLRPRDYLKRSTTVMHFNLAVSDA